MNNEIFVSIIVPIYNAEKYLEICVSSLLMQTYQCIEIILVDDGSLDNSAELCDVLASRDKRIRVIHQPNSGVSTARNVGTAHAKGQYIMYVDADDILAEQCVENGVNLAMLTASDLVVGAIRKISTQSEFDSALQCDNEAYACLCKRDFDQLRAHYFNPKVKKFNNIQGKGDIDRGPYARLIKAELAKECKFNAEHKIGEDVLWNFELLNRCDKICVSKNIWYGYVINNSSAIRKYYGNREELVSKYLKELYEKNKNYIEKNKSDYVLAVAVEFYCLLNFEYNSNMCPLTKKEKNRLVKSIRKKEPWKALFSFKAFFIMSFKYKLLILAVRLNLWQQFLGLKKRKS